LYIASITEHHPASKNWSFLKNRIKLSLRTNGWPRYCRPTMDTVQWASCSHYYWKLSTVWWGLYSGQHPSTFVWDVRTACYSDLP